MVPNAVAGEVLDDPAHPAPASLARFVGRHRVPHGVVPLLLPKLGSGESAAIALAMSMNERPNLLMDDRQGRAAAWRVGISTIGSAGLLVEAKRAGLVNNVAGLLEQLKAQGLYVSDQIAAGVLGLAGKSVDHRP